MKSTAKHTMSTRTMVLMAMLTALVVILTWLGSFIRLTPLVTVSLTLVPIVLGAVLTGPLGGAWLGLVNALFILFSGQAVAFMTISIPGTILVVLAKGVLCGLCAALVYHLLEKTNRYLAIVVAAIVCPIVNSGIFLLGCLTVFLPMVESMLSSDHPTIFAVLIYGMGLINFPFELLFNIVLCPVIDRLLRLLPKFSKT